MYYGLQAKNEQRDVNGVKGRMEHSPLQPMKSLEEDFRQNSLVRKL